MMFKRVGASIISAALILTAPGLDVYRVLAQQVVTPRIPVSAAAGAGPAAGAAGSVALPAPAPGALGLAAPLALPQTLVPVGVQPAAPPVLALSEAAVGRRVEGAAPASALLSAATHRPSAASAQVFGTAPVAAPAAAAPVASALIEAAASGRVERAAAQRSLLQRLLWQEPKAGRPAEPTALGRSLGRLAAPALKPAEGASNEAASQGAEKDFERRRGLAGRDALSEAGRLEGAHSTPEPAAPSLRTGAAEDGASPAPGALLPASKVQARHAGTLSVEGPTPDGGLRIEAVRPQDSAKPVEVHRRSLIAPAAAAAVAGAAWLTAAFLPSTLAWAGQAVGASAAVHAAQLTGAAWAARTALSVVSIASLTAGAGLALYAAIDAALFVTALIAGRRGVTERDFHDAVRGALRTMGLGPGTVAGLAGHAPGRGVIHAYRGGSLATRLSLGFTTPYGVYLRPELARSPWLLRLVLRHELYHFQVNRSRAPPGAAPAVLPGEGLFKTLARELGSRFLEATRGKWLSRLQIPVLERVLRQAQVALDLPYGYDVIVVEPAAGGLRDPAEIEALSGGKARVTPIKDLSGLDGAADPARLIVTPEASGWLPRGDDASSRTQAQRLEQVLKRLDERYLLSKGLKPTGTDKIAPKEFETLARKKGRFIGAEAERYQKSLSLFWRHVATTQLKDVPALGAIAKIYARLQDRGVALLPFGPSEPGVDVLLRLMRYWEGPDGGRLEVERIDLPEGGHVLVARKLESRIHLWLRPLEGRALKESITNISRDPSKAGQAAAVLSEAGFTDRQQAEFKKAGVEVRHAFGADVGENRIYVSVPKRKAKILKRYAEAAGTRFEASRGGYQVHLLNSVGMQNLPQTWKLRVEGEGGRVFDIDTGIDLTHPDFAGQINAMAEIGGAGAPTPPGPQGPESPLGRGATPRVTSYDVTGEGNADFIGHGTHKASISYASGPLYKGMAPKAEGRMGKVFTRDGFGAADGDIMAAAAEAMKWGADVISLSLGTTGDVGDPLSEFFSKLAGQKNSKGQRPIITASMGNSGPSNRSGSQPAAGENVIAVAAAAKSLDDKEPEISFFSAVGFARDTRFHLPRWVLKPSITALGGDVVTRPGFNDVYEKGIEAAKSKDMEPSPSDTPDRLHTRMSGTSMSNPMIAGIALLVKQIALRYADAASGAKDFFLEQLPYAVRVILERSARDMRVPVPFQGSGLVDAYAAAKLAVKSVGGPDIETATGWRGVLRLPATIYRRIFSPASAAADAGETPWDWIARAKAVQDVEKAVFQASEKALNDAARQAQAKAGEPSHPEAPVEEPPQPADIGNKANAAAQKAFNEAREVAAPMLVQALKDPVWLVRYYAAISLINLRYAGAALDLAQVALGDEDARVRQAAFLALAATPSHAADGLLAGAAREAGADRVDVALYAAYALARHGDGSAVARLMQETTNPDKKVRFTAAWLIGEAGAKTGKAGADALGGRVRDLEERGNIRHLAVAALSELSDSDPNAITDEAIVALLDSAGAQDLALTRTVSKWFAAASHKRPLIERMRAEPLKPRIMEFILANKSWVGRPGALGEMVSLLARVLGVPLDIPSPAPDPDGAGVTGVDPNLGPVHLIIEAPAAARIEKFQDLRGLPAPKAAEAAAGLGLDPQTLQRHEAALQVAMPVSQTFWVNAPDSKVAAFTEDLEAKGYKVHRARPKYRMLNDTGPLSGAPELQQKLGLTGKGVLVVYLDEGGDLSHPGISKDRIGPARNFSGEGAIDDVTQESIGHGTHGMGIVGARAVDGSPYVGMAPDVRFAVGKVLGANGGSDAMVMAGMEWAMSLVDPLKTPVVVNMSLGGPGEPDSPLSKLVDKMQLKDVAVVVAAGNEGPQEGTIGSPGNAALALRIGAVDKAGKLTFYSSRDTPGAKPLFFWLHRGGAVDFNMPNPYEIVSTLATTLAEKLADAPATVKWKDQALYQAMSGTSMAAPHATGQLAQLAQRFAEVMLKDGARPKDGARLPHGWWLWLGALITRNLQPMPELKSHEGAGLFDARAAAQALEQALKDPAKIRSEAEALAKDAESRYGARATGSGGFWLRPARAAARLLRSWFAPTLTAFTFPVDRLAVPVEKALELPGIAATSRR